ncbi:Gfo/Idh/MocA family protein [Pseudonocardia oceani]|uniref:Gfo/Idh/MocA family oxidoreductase n=4 Tax=Pseudonocardia oceani TaxID=2792013 RepID=A0ABS6UE24_9PSEU|nr:Gfo/Idh/MocA family oxidoreductase [Pseudonocardia oceani]MBW0130198.1 Gfo/Idh/MocA family oxidoreductase [Pseudonocardia oceani]
MDGTVNWGVVGCGWVARDHVLPGLRAVAGARVVGVHDRDPVAARAAVAAYGGALPEGQESHVPATTLRERGFPATPEALDSLLQLPDLHALYLATPTHTHPAVVAAVASSGLALLCEKPLAPDVAGAQELVDAAPALAGTAFDQRFHPAHRRIAEIVAAGELGTVTAVRIVYGCWLPPDWSPDGAPQHNWRVDPGGGAVIDLAPHGVDLVGTLLGGDDLVALSVLTRTRVHDYPVDDGGVLAGHTAGGVLYSAHVSFATPDALPRRRLEVVGTRAQLVAVDTLGQTPGGTLTRIDATTGEAVDVPFDTTTSPFTAQLAAFSAAVAGTADWPYPLHRDLALHTLLLTALERT